MSDDERAIRQVVETWSAATQRGDMATVLDLMTEDVVFMIPGQEPFGKDEFAAAFKGMGDTKMEGTNEIVELRLFADWAFIRNRLDLIATLPDGKVVRRSGYTLTLLHKQSHGQWRLARDANLLAARD